MIILKALLFSSHSKALTHISLTAVTQFHLSPSRQNHSSLLWCFIAWPLLCFISSMRHPFSSKFSHFQVLSQNFENCRTKNSSMHGYFLHSSMPVFIHALFNYCHSHVYVKGYRTFTLIHAGSWQSSTSECLYPLCQYTIQQGMIRQCFTQLCRAVLCISATKNSYFHI